MLYEIHMLKNYPPTNLNRDDSGAPKSCQFGGTNRGRISSQCLKRSWRTSPLLAQAIGAEHLGTRTRRLPDLVAEKLEEMGVSQEYIQELLPKLSGFGNKDGKENKEGNYTAQVIFYAPEDIQAVADVVKEKLDACETLKQVKSLKAKDLQEAVKGAEVRPVTLDMALFGRMVTSNAFRDVEASMQVAHAISTNQMNLESDYFTAMDDLLSGATMEEMGAAIIGDTDYNSSCYYLYASLDTEILRKNLKDTPDAEALNQALNEARGSKVELYVPQRGDVAKLVTMAYTNAVERLGRESGRYTREEKLLEEAAQVLGLKTPPRVIESYDISNWGDGSSVCGMVVFKDGKPCRAGYRRFKMRTIAGTDDYASMAETLSRRAAEYEAARRGEKPDNETNQFATMPDLLLIDGGRGQVSAVKQALRGTALEHVPTFGMVKDDHHRTRAIVDDAGGEIAINRHRNIFTFVTNIQDETHRYANDYRKRMMHKKSYAATLTELPVAAVKAASISDLEEVKGISHAKAENIYNALRQ